ncbi:hypothetical protein [Halorubrum depositum]|uniref:hypothetical protein n=1 Tax=Halorubrum depositum TaxID=2583992 RepID=UPI0011A2282E|nr:hypothetical protein [Halorubrum depositum]
MTDDAESRPNERADTERVAAEPDPAEADGGAATPGTETSQAATGAFGDDAPAFGDLSLPQRVFVAAVQNPTRGVVIAGLLAFGFSFYVAFWLVFPRVAAFMSAIGAVLVAIVALVYLVSDRVSG